MHRPFGVRQLTTHDKCLASADQMKWNPYSLHYEKYGTRLRITFPTKQEFQQHIRENDIKPQNVLRMRRGSKWLSEEEVQEQIARARIRPPS